MKLHPASTLAVLALLTLSGCVTVQVQPPEATPTATAPDAERITPTAGAAFECDARPVLLNGAGASYRLSGECGTVDVEGQDIRVELDRVGVIEVHGDRVIIDADAIGTLSVSGQSNAVDADSADSVSLRGDRNSLFIDTIGTLTIGGNDNVAKTDEPVGAVTDNGSRNDISTD
jgi:hypothetical protein